MRYDLLPSQCHYQKLPFISNPHQTGRVPYSPAAKSQADIAVHNQRSFFSSRMTQGAKDTCAKHCDFSSFI